MRDSALNIGKVLGLLTILLCFSVYYLFFALFGYFLSQIFIWISKAKLKTKILWTILPLLLGSILMNTLQAIHHKNLQSKSLKLEFRLEENFVNEIIVFDNVKCGQKEEVINGRKVLYVPSSGVVYYSKDLTNDGYIDNLFRRRKGDNFEEIPTLYESMFSKETIQYNIKGYTAKTFGVYDIGHYDYYEQNPKIKYLFFVGSKNKLDSLNWYKIIGQQLKKLKKSECK